MANILIQIDISELYALLARRTSLTSHIDANMAGQSQLAQLHGEGDRITLDLIKEAAKEILKFYLPKQWDIENNENPFQVMAQTINYRFKQKTPVLAQNNAIVQRLTLNTRDAILYFSLAAFYKLGSNTDKVVEYQQKYKDVIENMVSDIYRLHD